MEPEVTASAGNKKKFLIITLAVILAVGGLALGYLFMQKDTPEQVAEAVPTVPVVKSAKQVEKERILAELAQVVPKDKKFQAEERAKILKTLAKQAEISPAELTAEKERILQELSASASQ